VLGRDDDEHRARFGRAADRLQHLDALDGLVAQWIAAHERSEVLARFQRERIPAAPVNDLTDVLSDAHVQARGSVVEMRDETLGAVRLAAPAPRLSATPGRVRHLGPELGEHNDEVLREWLEIGANELARLQADGAM